MKKSELRQLIKEETQNILNENLTIKDWDEYVNPDYVLLTLSNDRKLKITKQNIKGGKHSYQIILTLLDNMSRDPKAMEAMLKLVNMMVNKLTPNS